MRKNLTGKTPGGGEIPCRYHNPLSPKPMTNYQSLAKMIREATTRAELDMAEVRCTRHCILGTISATELAKLDGMICEKFHEILLANEQNQPTITPNQ